MISKKQILDIREHLKKAQNPLFYFDNDADGLCSYLLLRKYLGIGKGVPVKGAPELTESFFSKVNELNPDYIFILDTPVVSLKFFEQAIQREIPVVWIDHHKSEQKIPKEVFYYNSLKNKKGGEPVTYISYKIAERKEDLWIAVAGCISDSFVPEFYEDFKKEYPELSINSDNAFKIVYSSGIGTIIKILNYFLKDRTTNVINMVKFLTKAKSPYDVLNEDKKNSLMHQTFNRVEKRINSVIEKFKEKFDNSKNVLYLEYGGDLSVSSEVSNRLKFEFPEKIIIVAYVSKDKVNISARGENIRKTMKEIIEDFEGATTGGHRDAVGAKVKIEDLGRFKSKLEKYNLE